MGYDIHITRARYWFEEDEDFVTLDDVIAVWDKLDKGFSIDRNGVVYSNPLPDGSVLAAEVDDFIVYRFGDGENEKAHIYFDEDFAPRFNGGIFAHGTEKMIPIIRLARLVGAVVQGDEGEIYDEEHLDGYFPDDEEEAADEATAVEDEAVPLSAAKEKCEKKNWVVGLIFRTNLWIYVIGAVASLVLCTAFLFTDIAAYYGLTPWLIAIVGARLYGWWQSQDSKRSMEAYMSKHVPSSDLVELAKFAKNIKTAGFATFACAGLAVLVSILDNLKIFG